ncbi:MAG: hypothetical protein Kow0037_05250 [Calditrichia bacterium]
MNFYGHALLATVSVGLAFYLFVKYWLNIEIKKALGLAALAAPLCPIVNLLVKKPFFGMVLGGLGLENKPETWPLWFLGASLFVAPVTEEAIKVMPVALKAVRKNTSDQMNAFASGFCLGTGFGVGEIWYLVWSFTGKMPDLANGPFSHLVGFSSERILATLVHGFLTAILVYYLAVKRPWRGYFMAVLFHALVNVGAALYQAKIISIYWAALPILSAVLLLVLYAFKIERAIRREQPITTKGVILYRRSDGRKENGN